MPRTSEAHIVYSPRPDATAEGELTALAAVYSFVIKRKEGGPYTAPDDRKGLRNVPARTQHTR
jgi:hypothetical protein